MNQKMINKHMNLLGLEATDLVTGVKGVITSISFDLYGCVQVTITPKAEKNKRGDAYWYDITRLKILKKTPVMKRPNFDKGYIAEGKKGCELSKSSI